MTPRTAQLVQTLRAVTVGVLTVTALAACSSGPSDPDPVRAETPASTLPTAPVPSAAGTTGVPDAGTSATPARPSGPSAAQQARLDDRLRAAAWADDVVTARRLVRAGADVNAKDDTQQSAYLVATSEGYLDLLNLTLANGARVNDKDSWNGTGLIRAAERGHHDVVGRLLQAGIDRNHVNRLGYQAVHEAVWLGEDTDTYVRTLQVLHAGGAQMDRASRDQGLTPLQMAERKGHERQARSLRAMTSAEIANPDASLLSAARTGDADLAAAAIRAGADLNVRDRADMNRTPLLVAANHDSVAVAQLLVSLGADPDLLDDQHDTAFLVTGVTGSVEMGKAILAANPDLTVRNRYGGLSPIPAGERGHVDYIRWVVTTHVDINHRNDLGWTSLLEAIVLGDGSAKYQEIVRLLLQAGADPSIADKQGRDARELAVEHGHREIVKILDNA